MMAARILEKIGDLPPEEQTVLRLKFGIGEDEPLSEADIARRLRIAETAARDIVSRALEKLKLA
jgi:DNA-directed RNA polymerase sigma subunit (sigma70/sigma32)